MKLKLLAVIVLAAVGVGALIYTLGGVSASAADTTEYLTSPATIGDVTDDIAATGTLQPEARYGLAFGVDPWLVDDAATGPTAPATYPVTEVLVAVGDTVTVGDPIATADTSDLKTQLARAKNDRRAAKVRLAVAEDELEDADVTARVRQARIGRYDALNGMAAAEAAVAEVEAQIAGATLVAPVAGLVTEVNVRAGFDAPGGAAAVIDTPVFTVTTDVVESDLVDVRVGQTAAVTVSAIEQTVDGTVTAIAPVAADGGSGVVAYPVTVTLTDPPSTIRSGMSADVTITIASAEDVLTVPSATLDGTDGNYSVLVLGADGTPTPTAVEVGLVTNTTAEITSGLAEGAAVVTGTTADLLGTNASSGFPGGGGGVVVGGSGAFPGGGQFRPPAGDGN